MTRGDDTPWTRHAQSAWMHSLRAATAHIEFVFNDGDEGHPLVALLAELPSTRTVGVGPSAGYVNSRHRAVKYRFAYRREIIRVIDDLGCFFPEASSPASWTALGNVDVVFLDKDDNVLGEVVTHERMVIRPASH